MTITDTLTNFIKPNFKVYRDGEYLRIISKTEIGGMVMRTLELKSKCTTHGVNLQAIEFRGEVFCPVCSKENEIARAKEYKKSLQSQNNKAIESELIATIGKDAFNFNIVNYQFSDSQKNVFKHISENVNGGWYFSGPENSGKSLFAKLLLKVLAFKNKSYFHAIDYELANYWGSIENERRPLFLNKLFNYDILIIDNLGYNTRTISYKGLLSTVMDRRIKGNNKLTIFTSRVPKNNLDFTFFDKGLFEICKEVSFTKLK